MAALNGAAALVVAQWTMQIELGGSRDVIGDTLIVNGAPLTIVGVAPAGFEGTYETLGIPLLAGRPFTDLQRRVPGATGRRGSWDSSRRRFWPPQCHCSAPSASIRWPRCAPSSRHVASERQLGTEPENRARQLVRRIEFCYTPKHGSRLNIAERDRLSRLDPVGPDTSVRYPLQTLASAEDAGSRADPRRS